MKRARFTNSYWWREQFWKVRDYFNPRQKWLVKVIPKTYTDKVELVPLILFEILINFVEDEEGLDSIWSVEHINDPYISEDYRAIREPIRKELDEVYEYIKTTRKVLQDTLGSSYPEAINGGDLFDRLTPIMGEDGKTIILYEMKSCEEIYGKSYEEAYADVRRIEDLIEQKDAWAMETIVKHRNYLWT
jgi:hypothetical protein